MALSQAERQKLRRERARRGEAVWQVPVQETVILALLESGRLTESEALDKHKLQDAAGELLHEWARRWLQ